MYESEGSLKTKVSQENNKVNASLVRLPVNSKYATFEF